MNRQVVLEATDRPPSSEPESLSDSDWLDISSTDRDSDNDSIFSSRGTDHERPSRSRQSSLSYGSSRDGDVEVWQGMIEDSADEESPEQLQTSSPVHSVPHVDNHSVVQAHLETSLEEFRVKEGLDQSMVSTLSSSRSNSLHASTIHNSLRDLRLSFPDPITSSREDVTSSYEDIGAPDATRSASDSYVIPIPQQTDEQAAEETLTPHSERQSEFNIFLYGLSTPFKWSVAIDLLEKVAQGAGVTFTTPAEASDDSPVRHFTVSTRAEHGTIFPSTITITDKTHQQYSPEGPTLMYHNSFPSLAIIFMPYCPPHFSEPTFYLPVLAPDELEAFSDTPSNLIQVAQETWNMFHIPERQVLRLTAKRTSVVDKRTIDDLDPALARHAFNHMWSAKRKAAIKTSTSGVHTLTILAVLSLLLGIVIRSTFPAAGRVVTAIPTVVVAPDNSSSTFLWQLLRPAISRHREIPPPPTVESSLVPVPASLKEFALSIFSAESTSMSLPRAHSPNVRQVPPSTSHERLLSSRDLMLRPTLSILSPDHQSKAVSIASTGTHGQYLSPTFTPPSLTSMIRDSTPDILKEYTSIDMQVILDALDTLVQAISKQVHTIVAETALLVQRSISHLEMGAEKLEGIKDALYTRNTRAKKRAKQLKERGAKWVFGASEVVTSRAKLAKGTQRKVVEETREFVEGMASRARGNAKRMAAEIHGLLQEQEKLAFRAWDIGEQQWKHWKRRYPGDACKSKRPVTLKKGKLCGL